MLKVVMASVAVVGTLWAEQMCRRRDGTVGLWEELKYSEDSVETSCRDEDGGE